VVLVLVLTHLPVLHHYLGNNAHCCWLPILQTQDSSPRNPFVLIEMAKEWSTSHTHSPSISLSLTHTCTYIHTYIHTYIQTYTHIPIPHIFKRV
jgi:hypothetical protein